MWSLEYIYDTVFGQYGELRLTAAPAPDGPHRTLYFLNGVSVTAKEMNMVRTALQDRETEELTAADFVDLKEVKKILEKVCANNAI